MKRKTVRKKKPSSFKNPYLRYFLVVCIIFTGVLGVRLAYQSLNSSGVLGTSITAPSDSTDSGDNQTGDNNVQNTNDSSPHPSSSDSPNKVSAENQKTDSQQLNAAINNEVQNMGKETQNQLQEKTNTELQVKNNQMELNSQQEGTQLQIKTENDGSVSIHAKKADGTEVQMQTDTLSKINEALQENDIQIGTTSANGFEITNKDTRAKTDFPINVNLATNTLSVDTPAGQKNLTVLPNQAVQNLLNQKIIDKVTQTSTSTNGAQLQLVQLRLYANNPVFQVNGTDNKKLLGFIPVSVQKTALVSAETGQLVTTNENLINQILDLLSTQ